MTTPGYTTIGPVAAQLGIPRWRLAYLIERGEVPGPSVVVPGRRLFSADDVERTRTALVAWEARQARNPRSTPQCGESSGPAATSPEQHVADEGLG